MPEHSDDQNAQMLQFIRYLFPAALAFAVIEGVAAAVFGDIGTGFTGLFLAIVAGLTLVARKLIKRGAARAAATILCFSILVASALTAVVQPILTEILSLTPLLAVGVALPYVNDRLIKGLIFAVWVTTVAVGVLGLLSNVNPTLPHWYEVFYQIIGTAGASAVVLLMFWSFRRRLNDQTFEQVKKAEERYALAERGANDGLWDWNLTSGGIYFSPRFGEMLGLRNGRVGDDPDDWFSRIHPDDRPSFEAALSAHLSGDADLLESEHRLLHEDGSYQWVLARGRVVRDEDDRPHRMAGSITDITRRRRAEEQARHDASHDALTGLPNRPFFIRHLAHAMQRSAKDSRYTYAILFLDLDRFKRINDSLGHTAGDELLKETACRLGGSVHPTDIVARLGGDEFVVLLGELRRAEDATGVADRLQKALREPFDLHGQQLYTTASIGLLINPEGYESPEELLRDADTAMYRAKEDGKARHAVFDTEMRDQAVSVLRLETDLRRAVLENEFIVQYQPTVALQSGRVTGFEALVRWDHPERGLLGPQEFIGLAEETGLICDIDLFVLEEACRTISGWRQNFPDHRSLKVAVNLSPSELTRPDLTDRVATTLENSGLPGQALRLELTESAIMEDAEAAARTLADLKKLGVEVHLDDFGTGYSSLSLLNHFPVDALKIDRSFVSRTGNGAAGAQPAPADGAVIVRTITTLAYNLGLEVIAEGVETAEQLQYLKKIGCKHAQGYYFSKPVDVPIAEMLLRAGPVW